MQTRHLTDTPQGLEIAAQVLRNGGRVAFPTETVYGLGADAGNATAVAGIYAAKGRPSFNPLIVHVPDIAQARELVRWSDTAEALAQAHWPGALTLVLPLRKGAPISRLVTAGLDSLAIRIPAADLARRLLRAAGVPVAAPSANLSGQISPTRASHVAWGTEALPASASSHRGLDGRIEAILDGGPCPVGVESTIVSLTGTPQVLRPGGIPQETIAATLRTDLGMDLDVNLGDNQPSASSAVITAPGQLASHYAPQAPLRLNAESFLPNEARLGFGKVACDLNLSPTGDLTEAAANLFDHMHRLDALVGRSDHTGLTGRTGTGLTGTADLTGMAVSPIPMRGLGVAINDRLRRAAAPR